MGFVSVGFLVAAFSLLSLSPTPCAHIPSSQYLALSSFLLFIPIAPSPSSLPSPPSQRPHHLKNNQNKSPKETTTHPFPNPKRLSLAGPSGVNEATCHQFVWRFSLGPLEVPTAYLMTSWPEEVGLSSGSAARRPTMEILARGSGRVVLKVRWRRGVRRRREGRRAGIVWSR